MSEFIGYDVREGIATIAITRPQKRNALSYAMYDAIRDGVTAAEADAAVRAIVLTGSPGIFCAGTDLTELRQAPVPDRDAARAEHQDGWHWFLWNCTKPVVAAIDGPAAGLGVELATQADVRVASSRAAFSWIFVQRGLIPDTGAGTWLLPQVVGLQQAKRLVLSGDFIDAAEAHRIGFVSEVTTPEALAERAREVAASLSSGSPFAIARAKSLLNAAASRDARTHLQAHAQALTECQLSEDHREGVRAFLEKRPAQFTGR